MTDVLGSIGKWFKDRTISPLYGTFVLSMILWNWKFFYILFWEGESYLSLPKIEYVQKYILNSQNIWQHLLYFIFIPALSTYAIVWWLSYASNWAHKKHLEFYYKRKLILDEAKLDYERREKNNLESISVVKKEQAVAKKEIEKNSTREEKWREEMLDWISNSQNVTALQTATQIIYKTSGRYDTDNRGYNDSYTFIAPDHLSRLDAIGLIDIDNNSNKIAFTEKGKYFLLLSQNNGKIYPF